MIDYIIEKPLLGTSGSMLYSAQSSTSSIGRNEHDLTGGHDSSPSRPISSPITPSSAALTRHLHGLMPLDGFQYSNNSPFNTGSNTINMNHSSASMTSASAGAGHHSTVAQVLHSNAIHSSVIHEPNVAKLLVHSSSSGQTSDNGLHSGDDHNSARHSTTTTAT
jgi:hypothetical protein